MLSPDLLLLDAASAGLAPVMRDMVFEKIAEINRAGTSILIVGQNAWRRLGYLTAGTCLSWAESGLKGAGWNYSKNEDVRRLYPGG